MVCQKHWLKCWVFWCLLCTYIIHKLRKCKEDSISKFYHLKCYFSLCTFSSILHHFLKSFEKWGSTVFIFHTIFTAHGEFFKIYFIAFKNLNCQSAESVAINKALLFKFLYSPYIDTFVLLSCLPTHFHCTAILMQLPYYHTTDSFLSPLWM